MKPCSHCFARDPLRDVVPTHNKQLERTVMRRHVRAACAALHFAHAARWTRRHAAAQLRR
jgi:hypothetical protein